MANMFQSDDGNAFLLIPSTPCEHPTGPLPQSQRPLSNFSASPEIAASPHREFVSRLAVSHNPNHETRAGFLWSKNHMVSRRWKLGPTCATSDESFQNKLFSDFKAFCRNDEGRLVSFWNYCRDLHGAVS